MVFDSVLLEEFELLLLGQHDMLWNKLMLSNVYHELILLKEFDPAWMKALKFFPSDVGSALNDNDGDEDVQLTHLGGDLLDHIRTHLII